MSFVLEKEMIKYTTPAVTLIVENTDITSNDIYVSLEQGTTELTKTGDALAIEVTEEGTQIGFVLTQEESALFDPNRNVSIQVNWISSNGVRAATDIRTIPVMKNLLDEVIEYGD